MRVPSRGVIKAFSRSFCQSWSPLQTRETKLESEVEQSVPQCSPYRTFPGHRHWKMVDIELFTQVKLVLRPSLLQKPVTQGSGITTHDLSRMATRTKGQGPS